MYMQLSTIISLSSDVSSTSIPSNTYTESISSAESSALLPSNMGTESISSDVSHMTHLEFEHFLSAAIQKNLLERAELLSIKELSMLENDARHGSKELLYRLGAIFYYGIGATAKINDFQRNEISRTLLSQAAKKQVAEAQYLYACTFYDDKMQEKWLNRAAKKGYAPAYIKLAAMAEECRLETSDFNQYYQWQHWAIKLLEKAYQLGKHQEASQQIARIYINGLKNAHPVLDYSTAVQWIEPLTQQSQTAKEACYALGLMFLRGQDQKQDYSLAFNWFQRALQSGYTAAEFELGYMYEQGWGCPKDLVMTQQKYLRAFEILIQDLTKLKQHRINKSISCFPKTKRIASLTPVQQQIDWNYAKCRHILEFLYLHSQLDLYPKKKFQTKLMHMQHTLHKFRAYTV